MSVLKLYIVTVFSTVSVVVLVSAAPVEKENNGNTPKSYAGYRLLRVNATTEDQFRFLENLWLNDTTMDLDFWKPPRRRQPSEIFVPPEHVKELRAALDARHIHVEDTEFDIQNMLQRRQLQSSGPLTGAQQSSGPLTGAEQFSGPLTGAQQSSGPSVRSNYSSQNLLAMHMYHSYEEIQNYLRSLHQRYPKLVQVVRVGSSHEGRALEAVKITNAQRSDAKKKAIWIDAGIHGREWIAPAVALYFINQLVERYNSSAKSRELVNNLIWYILPVVNPDGYGWRLKRDGTEYEYSRLHDRMWRKNRSPNGGAACKGVDLNRNFNSSWIGKGSSTNKCKDVYRGESPFSEPESRAVRDFVLHQQKALGAFITLHAYGQQWLYPYASDVDVFTPDKDELKDVASRGAKKLESLYGTRYAVGTGANVLYPASGGSIDWSKLKAGIKYAYLIELRPKDRFDVPEEQIIPTGRETWAGVVVVADEVQRNAGLHPMSSAN